MCAAQIPVIINHNNPPRRTVKASYTPKHINAAAQNICNILKKALLNLQLWHVVNGKKKLMGREMDIWGGWKHATITYLKALCCSSWLPSDLCTLVSGTLSHSINYMASLWNYLLNSMTKGHNGFTHSQCTSLQSTVDRTLHNKQNIKTWHLFILFYFPNPQQGTMAWEKTFWNLFKDIFCIKTFKQHGLISVPVH